MYLSSLDGSAGKKFSYNIKDKMNLEQLEKNFKSTLSKDNLVDMVAKAVAFANGYQRVRKYDSAIACLNILDVKEQKNLKAVIFTALGTVYWEKGQLNKAMMQFEDALKLFKELEDKAGKAAILSVLGITYWRKCEWDLAIENIKNALSQNAGKDERFQSLYGAFDRGIANLHNRIRLGRELEKPMKILQPLFASTALHIIVGNFKELKTCLNESMDLAEKLNQSDILRAAEGIKLLAEGNTIN